MTHANAWAPDFASVDPTRIALIVVVRNGQQFRSGQLAVSDSVADNLRGVVLDRSEDLAGFTAFPWSAQASWERDEYAILQRTQLDDDNPVLRALEQREQPDVTPQDVGPERIVLYALVVGAQPRKGAPDNRLLFVRKSDPRLSVSRRIVALWDNTLEPVTRDLFSFDRNIDLVLAPGRGLVAVNANAFELLFRETPELIARTPEYARRISANVAMTPDTERALVQAATKYARVRRRVLAIVERGHLATVTTAQLRTELRRQGLDPALYLVRGQLSFGPDDVHVVLRVLNEDLLVGGLSHVQFEVERKTPLD